jgi:antitoxin ParD1/3/4
MNVSLTPELERIVDTKVQSGLYQTASEVVREALRLMMDRDEGLERLRRDVRAGFEAAARGKFSEHDAETSGTLAAEVKAAGRALRGRRRETTRLG